MGDQTTALAVTGSDKLKAIMRAPDTMARFAEILGQHNAPAYVSSVLIAVANNDQLQQCSPGSIITSAMRAATLRLSCDPSTKQAHLVPFKGKATLVVGHKGYYDMAQRTGRYRYLNDFKVYEGQEVIENQLTGDVQIKGFRKPDSKVIGYGFYFELITGLKKVLYMTVDEIREHGEKYSKTFDYPTSLWRTNFEAMARKTVIRLCLSRYGYLDPTDAMTLSALDETEVEDVQYTEAPETPERSEADTMRELGFSPDPAPTSRAYTREQAAADIAEGEYTDAEPESLAEVAAEMGAVITEQEPAPANGKNKPSADMLKRYNALVEAARGLGLTVEPTPPGIAAAELAAAGKALRERIAKVEEQIP